MTLDREPRASAPTSEPCCPHSRFDHEMSENATHPCLVCDCDDWRPAK